jgi:hypothetical protein
MDRTGMKVTALSLILGFLFAGTAAGESIPLFSEGRPAPGYSKLLNRISPNPETVRFSDGTEITLVKKLGRGGTTVVYLSAEGNAVRIPAPENPVANMRMLHSFADQHNLLRDNDITIPDIVRAGRPVTDLPEDRAHPRRPGLEYVVVEKLEIDFLLADWIQGIMNQRIPLGNLGKALPRKEWEALLKFARSTWRFAFIADLKPENIGWAGGKWILFDWADHSLLYSEHLNKTVFTTDTWRGNDPANWTVKDWIYAELDQAARTERILRSGCAMLLDLFR